MMNRENKIETALFTKITQAPDGKISFADYMDWVLYAPHYGYYQTQNLDIGQRGDFFTSVSLGADFGELLAKQFQEMWQNLGQPSAFDLVEMGAGTGALAQDILQFLQVHFPECYAVVRYTIIEISEALIQKQKSNLSLLLEKITWSNWDEIPEQTWTGCCFSNELVDALSVHLVTLHQQELQEIFLTVQEDQLQEIIAPLSTSKIQDYFTLNQIELTAQNYPEGYRTEVNLQALDWLTTVASKLKMGYLLTIDYGYPAVKYYHPQRSQGTLTCYYQHRHHHDPYIHFGQQDITAQVNFTALEKWGESCQLVTLGFTQQALFLMGLGLGDRLMELSTGQYDFATLLKRRDALHQLIEPTGLGKFGVLIQGKGLTPEQRQFPLSGLVLQ
jgi:SAM-dependent MidA family methyltransferase